MKRKLDIELTTRYVRYLEFVKSYCEVVDIRYVMPTVEQFLRANALTRDRLLEIEPANKQSTVATDREPVTEATKPSGLLSFAAYVKQQEAATK